MEKQNSSHKLTEFGTIDYRKPYGKHQDMRTSSYIGHLFLNDTMLGNKTQIKHKEGLPYEEDRVLEKHRTTEFKANYTWKFGDPDEVRNISIKDKIQHMKPFYECNIKFLKRPMRPPSSTTHSDYLWQPKVHTVSPERPHIPAAVSTTKIVIDRNSPGYSKYLDPSATTTNLDYCYHSPQAIMGGIAANDNITFWNWKDIEYRDKNVFRVKDAQLCDRLPSKECSKRRNEFASKVKAVPNSGLTTEVRENYVKPNERALCFDDRHIKNHFTFLTHEPEIIKTEYSVLGSGESTQNIL